MQIFLDKALAYHKLGMAVIPLKPNSKEPCVRWKQYQETAPTEDTIRRWAKRYPDANIGILTGEISGGLTVLDIDPRNGGDESIKDKHLPVTPCAKTGGGGWHYFFISDKPIPCGTIAPGIDLKGTGGYVVAANSIHPNGNPYQWMDGFHPSQVEKHPLPDWVTELLAISHEKPKPSQEKLSDEEVINGIVELIKPYWVEGQRNRLDLSLCGSLAKSEWPIEKAEKVIRALCKQDTEAMNRLAGLESTYKRFQRDEEVLGYTGLAHFLPSETLKQVAALITQGKHYSVRDQILRIRAQKRVPEATRRDQIATLVRRHIKRNFGDFLLIEGPRHYFFERSSRMAFPIDGQDMLSLLDAEFGLNPNEKDTRCVIEHLISYTHRRGKKTSIYHACHFDRATMVLYVNLGAGRIARLDGSSIRVADNGTDGVLLMDDMEPIEPDLSSQTELRQAIFDGVNFSALIQRDLQEVLCWSWFRSSFFFSLLPTRPILALIGPKGSGKTFLLKVWLRLLYGVKRTEPDCITKEDAFEASLANNYFLTIDNADEALDWFNDALARAATGQIIRKRQLYTTNDEVAFQPRCFIAITSRTPHFKREDVSDRLMLIRLDRLPEGEFYREQVLLAPFMGVERNRIWGSLLRELNACVRWLKEHPLPEKSHHRMADWEALALTLAAKDGEDDRLSEAMKAMETERLSFVLEDDTFITNIPKLADCEWRTSKDIWEIIGGKESTFKSPRSLAAYLTNTLESLRTAYGMEVRRDGHTKTNLYRFPAQTHQQVPDHVKRLIEMDPIEQEDPPPDILEAERKINAYLGRYAPPDAESAGS